jgi:hypothetical protein
MMPRFTAAEAEEELRYCLRLARDGRTAEVPPDCVESYFRTQAAGARMDDRDQDALVYSAAADAWPTDRKLAASLIGARLVVFMGSL